MHLNTKIILSLLAIIPSSLQNACTDIGGYCHDVGQYSCDIDRYPVKGYCPGPANIQCCIVARSAECEQNYYQGRCLNEGWCEYVGGMMVTGICPGPNNIKCCYFRPPTQ